MGLARMQGASFRTTVTPWAAHPVSRRAVRARKGQAGLALPLLGALDRLNDKNKRVFDFALSIDRGRLVEKGFHFRPRGFRDLLRLKDPQQLLGLELERLLEITHSAGGGSGFLGDLEIDEHAIFGVFVVLSGGG